MATPLPPGAVDLDGAAQWSPSGELATAPAGSPGRPHRRRRARRPGMAVVAVLAVVAGLLLATRAERAEGGAVELVAVDGELAAVRQPTSADYNTVAWVSVRLRNTGSEAVTVRAVRLSGAGALMRDDLTSGGGSAQRREEARRRGILMTPEEEVAVTLRGPVRCPRRGDPAPTTGSLTVTVAGSPPHHQGRDRALDVAAPPTPEWEAALATACS